MGNSTIMANTSKNRRKAEKKKRALQRRMSEGDAGSVELGSVKYDKKMTESSSVDLSMITNNWKEEELADSGLASSFEENLVISNSAGEGKTKNKKMTKKRSKQFVMSNELIFDLDI